MTERENFANRIEMQLREWCTEVEKMLAEASQAHAESLKGRLEELAAKQGAAQQKLQALKQTGDETWEPFKAELDDMLTELQQEFSQVQELARKTIGKSIGWAEGLAKEAPVESIGWGEGLAKEHHVESIGWAEGLAEEDPVESKGWVEGYDQGEN